MVLVETPSNPLLRLTDLADIARICRERGIICVADNTFASPWTQRPLELGFDIVVHSTTKYLNDHSDVIGGIAVVGQNPELAERLGFLQNSVGAIAGPFDAFLTLRGVRPWRCAGNATAATRWSWRNGWSVSRRWRASVIRACRRTRSTNWRGGRCADSAG
jgi:cystathionine gamma-lyase